MVFLETQALLLISGILLGGILALIALGLTLIFGVSGVLNIAHGDFLMLGALAAFWLFKLFGISPFASLLLVAPLFFVAGIGLNFLMGKPMAARSADIGLASSILITLGLSNVIEDTTKFTMSNLLGIIYFPIDYSLGPVIIGSLRIPAVRLISLVLIIVVTVLLRIFITRTRSGKLIRAVMQDREVAIMLGANPRRLTLISFGVGTAAAAVAGVFLTMVTSLDAFSGLPLTVDALTVVILGGLGSFSGALVGGIMIGVARQYTSFYVQASWAPAASLAILILVLILRPRGLFGGKT